MSERGGDAGIRKTQFPPLRLSKGCNVEFHEVKNAWIMGDDEDISGWNNADEDVFMGFLGGIFKLE